MEAKNGEQLKRHLIYRTYLFEIFTWYQLNTSIISGFKNSTKQYP